MTTYYAQTRIEHGAVEDGNNTVTTFEPDEKVTGLDEKTMKQLWDAGALYTKEGEDKEKTSAGERQADTPPGQQPPVGGSNPQSVAPSTTAAQASAQAADKKS